MPLKTAHSGGSLRRHGGPEDGTPYEADIARLGLAVRAGGVPRARAGGVARKGLAARSCRKSYVGAGGADFRQELHQGNVFGLRPVSDVLETDANFIQFAARETYTISLSYRIIAAGPRGFAFGFVSERGGSERNFVRMENISGSNGASGTASSTFTLLNYPDYQVQFKIAAGTGAVAIDDIRVTIVTDGWSRRRTPKGQHSCPAC